MAFSTRDARRQKMSAELRDWCATGAREDRRTLILRLSPQTDLAQMAEQLEKLGSKIVSLGAAVTIVDMSCEATRQAADLIDVVSIDAPTRLAPKDTCVSKERKDP